jgi:hypothetical protein
MYFAVTMKPVKLLLALTLLRTMNGSAADYIPVPLVVKTPYLIGAHYFPGWREGTHLGWQKIQPYPERKPTLGWYDEGNPEVTDWEIKWCLEHGISFFVYCWYRSGENKAIQPYLGHAIHDGLFKAKFSDKFRFAIMWENANGKGVSSEKDLLENLFPFWAETYFKKQNYLKIDGKPVLFIYSLWALRRDLGTADAIHSTFEKLRSAAITLGFPGLTLLCENRGLDTSVAQSIKRCGFDESFAYCCAMQETNPSPATAIKTQIDFMQNLQTITAVPFIPTVSMGWDATPWQPSDKMHWQLPPPDFKTLCQKVKSFMATLPEKNLGRRMLLLDNWNEWGEGHYIAPCQQYGFGYLDAVREVFTSAPKKHRDIVPGDIGRGPYDSLFRSTAGK